jgi:hypothetical protein
MAGRKHWETKEDEVIGEVNTHTGELLGMKKTRVCITQEELIKVYFNSIEELAGCFKDGLYKVMLAVWKYSHFPDGSDFEGNKFNNDKGFKEVCKKLGYDKDDDAINTAIYRLTQKGIIKRYAKGMYILNPKYFAKGTVTDDTRMKLSIEFDGKKKDEQSNGENEEEQP